MKPGQLALWVMVTLFAASPIHAEENPSTVYPAATQAEQSGVGDEIPSQAPPTSPESAASGVFQAPASAFATDGNLDIGKAGAAVPFKVDYSSFGPGHKVILRWTGTSTYNAPVQTTAAAHPLTFTVPKATVAQDFGKTATITYTVEVPGAPIQTSEPLTVNVMLEALPAPELPLAPDNKLDVGKASLSVPFKVAFASLAAGQKVTLIWGGVTPYRAAAQNTTSTAPLVFNVPREVIARELGNTVPVTYTVEIAGVALQTSQPLNIQVQIGDFPPPNLPLATGVDTALSLNRRYADTREQCDEGTPAFYCSGVVIRATQNGNYDPWDPSTTAITLGGVSFSYMRKDAFVSTLYHNSGFIFLAQQDAIRQGKAQEYLCTYPYDAWTAQPRRPDAGCGFQPRAAQADLSTCQSVDAITTEGWYAFARQLTHPQEQCSFSTRDWSQFLTSLKVRANRPANMPDAWNEILVRVWDQNIPAQLPIEAFFYKNPAGLAEARTYQQKYAARTAGAWLPVIKLDLAAPNDAPFSYIPTDQLIQP